ncbi:MULTISPECIES: hypothetical protein [unclassified Streptomyces]|uniref:hypothetical protein n=1 Tax=unclassified Streptomyces TaxID=2593676 RepID=UPI00381F2DF0
MTTPRIDVPKKMILDIGEPVSDASPMHALAWPEAEARTLGADMKRRVGRAAAAAYVVLIGGLAVAGAVHEQAVYYLLAVALTLPAGAVALPAMYGGYAALSAVGGIWSPVAGPGGEEADWLSLGSTTLNVVLLTCAAIVNVVLLERALRRRRRLSHR